MQALPERTGPDPLRPTLRRDIWGMTLSYVTMALPVIVWIALLPLYVGRFIALNPLPQNGAGAPEDATKQLIARNTAQVTSVGSCYLSSLPAANPELISQGICPDSATRNGSRNWI